MPRLVNKQRHRAACGPTALYNTVKALGYKNITYDMVHSFCGGFNYHPMGGMYPKRISSVLNALNIKYHRQKRPTYDQFKAGIRHFGFGILVYQVTKGLAHYSFAVHQPDDKSILIYNTSRKNDKALRKAFKYSFNKSYDNPVVWFIPRDQ